MPPFMCLDVNHLSFSYQGTPVLINVSFQVKTGEFIGIIGPNGGGKTTLLKLIMGFLTPSKGSIQVFGKPAKTFFSTPSRLSYVPQSMRFDREFPISVEEVVLSGRLFRLPWYGKFSALDREAAHQALEQVGLASFHACAFGKLSGGQAQRVLIARALVSQPQLLLLDEPTASVDSQAESDIYAILKALSGQMTILMVTHDLRAALGQVDRVLCVQKNAFSLMPEEVCQHFTLGLYPPPLIQSPVSALPVK